jgi:hypothetical protein
MRSNDMSSESSSTLNGRKIASFSIVHDYYQLVFVDGSQLSIYTPFTIRTKKSNSVEDCIGETILSAVRNKESLLLTTSEESKINISLKEDDMSGPEAAYFTDVTGQMIVWP